MVDESEPTSRLSERTSGSSNSSGSTSSSAVIPHELLKIVWPTVKILEERPMPKDLKGPLKDVTDDKLEEGFRTPLSEASGLKKKHVAAKLKRVMTVAGAVAGQVENDSETKLPSLRSRFSGETSLPDFSFLTADEKLLAPVELKVGKTSLLWVDDNSMLLHSGTRQLLLYMLEAVVQVRELGWTDSVWGALFVACPDKDIESGYYQSALVELVPPVEMERRWSAKWHVGDPVDCLRLISEKAQAIREAVTTPKRLKSMYWNVDDSSYEDHRYGTIRRFEEPSPLSPHTTTSSSSSSSPLQPPVKKIQKIVTPLHGAFNDGLVGVLAVLQEVGLMFQEVYIDIQPTMGPSHVIITMNDCGTPLPISEDNFRLLVSDKSSALEMLRRASEAGIAHRDLRWENILHRSDRPEDFFIVDWDFASFHRTGDIVLPLAIVHPERYCGVQATALYSNLYQLCLLGLRAYRKTWEAGYAAVIQQSVLGFGPDTQYDESLWNACIGRLRDDFLQMFRS